MLSVEPEVLQQLGVVHVVGIVVRHGEIAEAHHLFGGIYHQRAVDAGSIWFWRLLQAQKKIKIK